MKKTLLFFLSLLLCGTPLYAQEKAPGDPYHNWYTYYYLEKTPSKIPEFLKWMQTSGWLDKNPERLLTIEGFLSVIFADNKAEAEGWEKSAAFTGNAKAAVDYASQNSLTPTSIEFKTGYDLDRAWGAYFASRDTQYLARIVDTLDPAVKLSDDATKNKELHAADAITLGTNMTEHESVERFLQAESTMRTGSPAGDALKNLIANVRKQREKQGLGAKDGDFTALLQLVDPAVAVHEIHTPSGGAAKIQEMLHVRPDDKRTLLFFFAGMQLTSEYTADVTYDVRMVDPAGKTYFAQDGIKGLKQTIPTRFHIFHNMVPVTIAFDKTQKSGIYKVYATLKDNIGKKSIPFIVNLKLKKSGSKRG